MTIQELEDKANYIRDEVIRVAIKNKTGHIASSLSTVDILVALYYSIMWPFKHKDLYINNSNHKFENRDRLILSKGHGCYALYAILVDLGIIPKVLYEENELKGCIEYNTYFGLEASTGSLGHGLPMAVGMALALKKQESKAKVYCMLGDGECQEGTTWESMKFIQENNIDNIKIIVDVNNFMALEDSKFYSDHLGSIETDNCWLNGHDIEELINNIEDYNLIFADTIKGKGLKCMEGIAKFHYRIPIEEELKQGKTYGL